MRTLGTVLTLAVLTLTLGCGNSSSGTDASTLGTGGVLGTGGTLLGTGGTLGAGGATSTGTCNYPSCITSLGADCQPSGTCVTQGDATSGASAICFSNGVKQIIAVDFSTFAISITVKSATSTCYTATGPLSLSGPISLAIKDGSGTDLGAMTYDTSTSQQTITCAGGQPVVLNAACGAGASSSTTSTCAQGTCTP